MVVVDERRLAFGEDARLAARGAVTPATYLQPLVDVRVLADGERRAIVRRVAATRDETAIAPHVRRSPSFAPLVLAAIERGAHAPFAELIAQTTTLLAFANAVDVAEGLARALRLAPEDDAGDEPEAALTIDDALLADERTGFAWRRLASLRGTALVPLELGPIERPALDLPAVASVVAFLRFAASESDADARAALRSALAPIDPAEARTLLATAGDRANVLDLIETGGSEGGRTFAYALRSIARAYRVPDAGLSDVLAVAASMLGIEPATKTALERIARDFDAARALAPAWEAADAIAEIEAELAATPPRRIAFAAEPPPAVEPEPGAPVTARRAVFSASSLNAFAECERKWYFRYVCAAVEDRGSSASFYGIAFHAALEDFHADHKRFNAVDGEALGRVLDFCVVTSFDRHRTRFDAPVEFELQKRRARRTAKRYLRWLLQHAQRAPFEVIGCETSTEVKLGDYDFVGYIDRLDRDDASGAVTVVDYKTGSIAKSANEYLTEVLAFREFQLPFYYWARVAAGDRVSKLALVPLKDALLDVEPIELTVVERRAKENGRFGATSGSIARDDLVRARDRMVELAATLAKPSIAHYRTADDPDACRYCAYRDACRERPLASEDRFGR